MADEKPSPRYRDQCLGNDLPSRGAATMDVCHHGEI
jgi:hypothetical protein